MMEITLKIDGLVCEAHLCDRRGHVLAETRIEINGPTNWDELLAKVSDELKLHQHPPPGLLLQGETDEARKVIRSPWQPVHFQSIRMHGFGWGFWLPCGTETCCGFLNHAAAQKAARLLRTLEAVITGDLPNGTFEIFHVPDGAAFFDLNGELHSTFPTIREARGCAAKLEALQMHQATPEPSIPI